MKSKRAREAATAAEDVLPVHDAPMDKKRKRNEDEPTNDVKQKKPKKDKKDKKKHVQESRKEKKDKRKDLQDLPEEDVDEDEAVEAVEVKEDKKDKEPKKEKKEKKEKKSKDEVNGDSKPKDEQPKKEKKDKKKKSKDKTATDAEEAPSADNDETTAGGDNETGKNSRYIVFVGNLPFTATAETIKAHFITLKPVSVRCLKNKDDDKPCRGIAFVEFGNVWTMRTCLDKFHHTEFEGRKINVELTAGGGGKTKFRKDKIREKNKKLDENRSKRIEKEKTAKTEGGGASRQTDQSAGGIHPSRLAMNPRLAH